MQTKAKRKTVRATAPKRGRRVENKQKTRKAILTAALGLFSTKGFFKTTTKQISQKAGIAEGTLFNYFRTKEDLALYFFDQELEALMKWFYAQTRLRSAALPEQLFAIIHRHLERVGPYEEFIGAVYLRALQPVSKLSPLNLEAQSLNLRYLRFVRSVLEAAEGREEIPQLGDIGAYAFGIFHVAMLSHWLQDDSPGKEKTLALLDRSLKLATTILKRGRWDW